MPAFIENGIHYSDDTFHQQGPPLYQVRNGLTVAIVKFRGPAPKAVDFAADLQAKRFPDIQTFGAPFDVEDFSGYDMDDDRTFPTFSLYFDIGTVLREPYGRDGLSIQSAVITIIAYNLANANEFQSNQYPVQVRCPTTTWAWFETTRPPDVPRHRTVRSALSPFSNIVSGLFDTGMFAITESANTKAKAYIENFKTSLESALAAVTDGVEEKWDGYDVEDLIPGKLWQCTCTAIRQPSAVSKTTVLVPYDKTILD